MRAPRFGPGTVKGEKPNVADFQARVRQAGRRGRHRRVGVDGFLVVCDRAGRSQGRDRRRRRGRGDGGALRQEGRAGARRHADRGQPDLQLVVLLQPLSRRLPHPGVAQPRLRRPAQARRQGRARLRHRRRHRQEDRQDPGRPQLPPTTGSCSRPASTSSTTPSRATRARPRASCRTPTRRRPPASASSSSSCRPCATAAPW